MFFGEIVGSLARLWVWRDSFPMFRGWLCLLGMLAAPTVVPVSLLPDARFVEDLHAKKIEDVLALYTDDAIFVNPDGSMAYGRTELKQLYQRVTGAMDSDLHLHPEVVKQMGRTVEESGNYTETLRHRDTGKVESIQGKYRFVGRREMDGGYKYSRMEWH
jgi:ketosteroid isomerase-like protein